MKKQEEIKRVLKNWPLIVKKYQKANLKKAIIQIINSFGPFLAILALMYFTIRHSYWVTISLAILNAFFLVRILIIQHDCGHQSFFKSKTANKIVGFICSFFTIIPFKFWAKNHNFHHTHNGMLEVKEIGDVPLYTVEEYKQLSPWKKFCYRIYRHPFVLFVIGPLYYYLIQIRVPILNSDLVKGKPDILLTNFYLVLFYGMLIYLLGWKQVLIVQGVTLFLFGIITIWFFYVQHQHEHGYKQSKENWEYLLSAITGSSYYKLPKSFQWLTGNIGFHHIHHLSSRIPNYNLEKCNRENPILEKYVSILTFRKSLKCMFYKLWDEKRQKMITLGEYQKFHGQA